MWARGEIALGGSYLVIFWVFTRHASQYRPHQEQNDTDAKHDSGCSIEVVAVH